MKPISDLPVPYQWHVQACLKSVEYVTLVDSEKMAQRFRTMERVEARQLLYALLFFEVGLRVTEIAKVVGKHHSSIAHALNSHARQIRDKTLRYRFYVEKYESCLRHYRYQLKPEITHK